MKGWIVNHLGEREIAVDIDEHGRVHMGAFDVWPDGIGRDGNSLFALHITDVDGSAAEVAKLCERRGWEVFVYDINGAKL